MASTIAAGLNSAERFGRPAVGGADPTWIAQAPGCWWVLHTRARNEKRVADELAEHGVTYYLPLVPIQRTYAKSRVTFHLPLFPGYVFLAGGHEECDRAIRTHRVASIIPVRNQEQFRAELTQIYRVVASGDALELLTAIPVGTRCRVRSGPFEGLEGVVVQQGRRCRLHLSVSILGQSAVIEMDAALLEALG